MLLIAIESRYLCHFIVGERKVEDADVFLDVVGIAGTGNCHHMTLVMPAQYDLNDGTSQIYTLDGGLVSTLQKGMNITHMNDGTAKKLLVR